MSKLTFPAEWGLYEIETLSGTGNFVVKCTRVIIRDALDAEITEGYRPTYAQRSAKRASEAGWVNL